MLVQPGQAFKWRLDVLCGNVAYFLRSQYPHKPPAQEDGNQDPAAGEQRRRADREIEHVNADALQQVLDEGLVKEVHPTPSTIKLIQEKYNQKKFLTEGGVPVADFVAVGPEGELGEASSARLAQQHGILDAARQFGYPLMIKSRTQAYDGKGNFVVKSEQEAGVAVEALGGGTRGLYAERWTPFEKEVAVMVVRSHQESTDLKVSSAAMINILGLADLDKDAEAVEKTLAPAVRSLSVAGATVHLYGKTGCRRGRKMGHITIVGKNDAQVRERYQVVLDALDAATCCLSSFKVAASLCANGSRLFTSSTLIGIIMGSDSDLPVMLPAAHILKRFNIPFELTIVSAHRTPDRMTRYAREAPARGLRVIIAGAGGAAHLPGMVAAQTPLPVVGVPVKGSTLDGVDSLHSIVQMPRGIPVATVAINNSTNAALLATRIVASGDASLLDDMQAYMDDMEAEVMGKVERLQELGWDYVVKK
ncbi:hypothetical protein L7F22_042447 [Adiantum nelumboides]|nr:hypothetical protein [Adiantum nelumboides]